MAPPKHEGQDVVSSKGSLKDGQPLLEHLVGHFLASKRSLASTSRVWHANEMVAIAKDQLESIASLRASIAFLRSHIGRQIGTLRTFRHSLEVVGRDFQVEFKGILQELDAVDMRIKRTVDQLKTTLVETSFNPKAGKPMSLYDFVDEHAVKGLTKVFHQCIDETREVLDKFARSNSTFDDELENIDGLLKGDTVTDSGREFRKVALLFHSLESHAAEMAQLLESLVHHYDLCTTALKHTEGGGEAVQKAAVELPDGIAIESFHQDALTPPITPEERAEMLEVLEKDAGEVEEVVQEIRDHSSDMESELEQISITVETLRTEHAKVSQVVKQLEIVGSNMAGYLQCSRDLSLCWNEQKLSVQGKLEELEALREFYDGFLQAYDGLILEIGRRKAVKGKMEKVVRDALSKLEKLYQEDIEEREAFRLDQGDYLPSDIWPGLITQPLRYDVRPVDEMVADFPEISLEATQKAKRRLASRT